MGHPDLLMICFTAFAAVFLLLTLLAVVMQLITLVFPAVKHRADAATVAAIQAAFQRIWPGANVTRIEEKS